MTVFTGYIPNNTQVFDREYTTSPSGTYYGTFLGGSAGQFVVVRGSNPAISPVPNAGSSNVLFSTPRSQVQNGGFFSSMQSDGNFVIYSTTNNTTTSGGIPVFATNTQGRGPTTFAQVSDTGEFALYLGNNPSTAGKKVFSSGKTDPVKSIALNNINYDLNHVTVTSANDIYGIAVKSRNTTPLIQNTIAKLTLSYTKTESFSWSLAQSLTAGISSTVEVGVPGLIGASTTVSLSETTTISSGGSDTASKTHTFSVETGLSVPSGSTYAAQIIGQQETFDVPYTFSGVATYASGATANMVGSGIFLGGDTGNFQVQTDCLAGCASGTPGPLSTLPATSVAEPIGTLLVPTAIFFAAVSRRVRRVTVKA